MKILDLVFVRERWRCPNRMKQKAYIGIALAALVIFIPSVSHAAASLVQIVPTTGQCNCTYAPDWGCVMVFIQNLLTDAVAVGTLLISAFIARAGFMFISQPGNAAARTKARQSIINAVLGLVIVLGAYLLIDSVMKEIYNQNANGAGVALLGPWNSIMISNGHDYCIVPNKMNIATSVSGAVSQLPNTTANAGGGATGSGSSGLNTTAAISWLNAHVTTTVSAHRCLASIEGAVSAGGLSLTCPSGWAGNCNSSMQSLKFTPLGSSDPSPQPGDVVVIQHPTGNPPIGHIAMFTGSQWDSDFIQSIGETPPGNPYGSAGAGFQYWRP
jgi:hypothetical protein